MSEVVKPKRSILIINPNTTQSMTNALKSLIEKLDFGGSHYTYLTAPSGVPSINNEDDAQLSTLACLPLIKSHYLETHNGFLVCCFSAHPLVARLRAVIAEDPGLKGKGKVVTGIFEASVAYCLQTLDAGERFGIVSTGAQWQTILDEAVQSLLGGSSERYVGTQTTGLNADELHSTAAGEVEARMVAATRRVVGRGAKAVVLGCAGMVGLEGMVRKGCVEELGEEEGGRVRIVDGVVSGVVFVEGALRAGV